MRHSKHFHCSASTDILLLPSYYDYVTAGTTRLWIHKDHDGLRAISRNLVVFAETKDGAEGSNWVVVVSGLVAVTSFVAVTSRVAYMSEMS